MATISRHVLACLLIVGIRVAVADLLVCPFDAAVTTGERVHLRCTARSADHMLRWFRDTDSTLIYSGTKLYPPFSDDSRYSVRDDDRGSVDLYIDDVTLSDAGEYRCIDVDDSASAAVASVIVVDRVAGYAEETDSLADVKLQQTCRFEYSGPTKAKLEWLSSEGFPQTDVDNKTTHTISASNVIIIASTTTWHAAANCRLVFPLSSCGHDVGVAVFNNRDTRTAARAGGSATEHLHTLSGGVLMSAWAFTATGVAMLFLTCTAVMCCMKTRPRRAKSSQHCGVFQKFLEEQASSATQNEHLMFPKQNGNSVVIDEPSEILYPPPEYEQLDLPVYQTLLIPHHSDASVVGRDAQQAV